MSQNINRRKADVSKTRRRTLS